MASILLRLMASRSSSSIVSRLLIFFLLLVSFFHGFHSSPFDGLEIVLVHSFQAFDLLIYLFFHYLSRVKQLLTKDGSHINISSHINLGLFFSLVEVNQAIL